MYNFNKKQKIILGIIIAVIVGFVCYYVYAREEDNSTTIELENNIETQEETDKEEEYSDDRILVHISGAVNKEGIIELKVNSRISDAIDQAEGLREDASIDDINLAYKLEDGMKVHIPTKQEKENIKQTDQEEYVSTSSGVTTVKEETQSVENSKNSKVNINTATQTQLETLPGIGPSTAIKILTYRKEKGKFTKIEELKEVSGIGEAKYEKIKEKITV